MCNMKKAIIVRFLGGQVLSNTVTHIFMAVCYQVKLRLTKNCCCQSVVRTAKLTILKLTMWLHIGVKVEIWTP